MKKARDPVIAAALEYESATLDALEALDGTDSEAQMKPYRGPPMTLAGATADEARLTRPDRRSSTLQSPRGRLSEPAS